jgi:hypothetical protein
MGFRLRLRDAELAKSLGDFLERRECVVRIQTNTVEVTLPRELDAEQARGELDLYLRVWQSLHQWTSVECAETP